MIVLQLALIGSMATILQVLRGGAAAPAVLFGGGVAVANLLLLEWRARRANRAGALSARQSLQVLYLSALERFAAVALLFVIGIGFLALEPLPLLLGFVAGLPALLLQTRPGNG
ncbi:MAG: ATP synthase subunit I [Gammaproteobacteria bacterium]|nr:ATP synthase subunit I [Gammaproteobacteria bacterium]